MFEARKRAIEAEPQPLSEQQFMDYTVEWLASIHAQLDRGNLFLEKIVKALEG